LGYRLIESRSHGFVVITQGDFSLRGNRLTDVSVAPVTTVARIGADRHALQAAIPASATLTVGLAGRTMQHARRA
jgi:hypothetical protein